MYSALFPEPLLYVQSSGPEELHMVHNEGDVADESMFM
jgi:hypothetical protein